MTPACILQYHTKVQVIDLINITSMVLINNVKIQANVSKINLSNMDLKTESQVKLPISLPKSQIYYLKGIQMNNPLALMKMQTTHIMILLFFIGGLQMKDKLKMLNEQQLKQKLIQYILSLQLKNGGFTCSTLYSKFGKSSKYQQGHIVFLYSALNCLSILGALDQVDKQLILKCVSQHQKSNGSFSSFPDSTQCDLRFVYSALSICRLFNNFSHINTKKAKEYIDSCYNFDGGFGLRPRDQSHCGAIYCAVASYQHLQIQVQTEIKNKILKFLVFRQKKCEQNAQLIGIQGRVGKTPDTCYSFWAGASIKILCGKNLLHPQIQNFIMSCFRENQLSFAKQLSYTSGDPVHTFHSILGLKILRDQADHISLSQILLKSLPQNKQQSIEKQQTD